MRLFLFFSSSPCLLFLEYMSGGYLLILLIERDYLAGRLHLLRTMVRLRTLPEIHCRDEGDGQKILDVHKAFAFAGFTHRSPRTISYIAFEP
ncbi:hypothetical protein BGY98DRAFT_1049156, partial [Russula aff. rugulosa BPL654]